MAKKNLNKSQLQELANMLLSGMTNSQVAEYFKISLATVNNHRTRLKREGMIFPSKKGRRAKQILQDVAKKNTNSKNIKTVEIEKYNFIINGVQVTVSGRAKNVHIGYDSMEVNF